MRINVSLLLILIALAGLCRNVIPEDIGVSIIHTDEKTGRICVVIRNLSDNALSIHLKTLESIQQSWTVNGYADEAVKEEMGKPVFTAELEESSGDHDGSEQMNGLDRVVDLKKGEGIGRSLLLPDTSFWKDTVERGIVSAQKFAVTVKPVIYVPGKDGQPVKTESSVVSDAFTISRQYVLQIEGERLERELRTPPGMGKKKSDSEEKKDADEPKVIYSSSNIPKIFVGTYLNSENGLLTVTARVVTDKPLSIDAETLGELRKSVDVYGVDRSEYPKRKYTYRRGVSISGYADTVKLDRAVVLKPGEALVNSVKIWECDFWNHLQVVGVGPGNTKEFAFRLVTTLCIVNEEGESVVDDAFHSSNRAIVDRDTLLKLEELRKSLHPEEQPAVTEDAKKKRQI